MSDFGADVIKIEPPGAGDPWRSRSASGAPNDIYWQLTARNKRSLALDLKHDAGIAALYKLVADVDVFITNFPLPVRQRLKMAPEHLLPLNPRLIYASFTAYGEAGEEAAKTGFDSTAYWARTGLMDAGTGGCGYPSVAVGARHGRSSQCHRALCRDRHGAVPAGEDRTRRRGEFIAPGQRTVGEWLLRADPSER